MTSKHCIYIEAVSDRPRTQAGIVRFVDNQEGGSLIKFSFSDLLILGQLSELQVLPREIVIYLHYCTSSCQARARSRNDFFIQSCNFCNGQCVALQQVFGSILEVHSLILNRKRFV